MDDQPIRDVDGLINAGLVPPGDRSRLEAVAREFSIALTPQVRGLVADAPGGPVAAQFLPQAAELRVLPEELRDPVGDAAHSPCEGVIHRYPDRALLLPLRVCAVYCRFCFRRETVGGDSSSGLSSGDLAAAMDYIASTPTLWEVILSGGDPLLLSPRRLRALLRRLEAAPHVRVVRIHTRIPMVDPERISEALLEALRTDLALYVAVHANHALEFSAAARAACARLTRAGIPLLSQSVLLRGVNDTSEALEALMRAFVENRIKPYYLHQGDLARGTGHFRVAIARGLELMEDLRGRVSGLCQPTYVIDLPGGAGKVPLGPGYLESAGPGHWRIRDRYGRLHHIQDPR